MDYFFHYLRSERFFVLLICLTIFRIVLFEISRPAKRTSYLNHKLFLSNSSKAAYWSPSFFENWKKRFHTNTDLDPTGLVRGIFLGDESKIPDEIGHVFYKTGLVHILSAGGSNCALVSQSVFVLLSILLFFLQRVYMKILIFRKNLYMTSSMVGTTVFFLLSNQSPPILRAAIFIFSLNLLSTLNLYVSSVRVLFIQYTLSLCIHPKFISNVSFQLSFFCLFGVILFPKVVRKHISLPSCFLIENILSSIGACLGAFPWTFFFFGEVTFWSVFTNIIATPIIHFGIMPCGLFSMVFSFFKTTEFLAQFFSQIGSSLCLILFQILSFMLKVLNA
ncbi:MAG: ComEC/Rec2 family competence protein [Bacteriovoracia bacterium]